jgi:hypothetical protein
MAIFTMVKRPVLLSAQVAMTLPSSKWLFTRTKL